MKNFNKMANHLHTSCYDELKKLLISWKLENILSHLIAEEIDVEILEVIKLSHIKQLLYKFSLGTQIRFEHSLEQWRYRIGKPLTHHSCTDRNQTINEAFLSTEILTEQTNNSYNSRSAKERKSTTSVNLKDILSQCLPDGPELLESYGKNHTFSNPERSHLINIIVDYFLKHDLFFNLYISYDLENSILSLFPNEKLEMYRNAKQGKIYTKYFSAKAAHYKQELPVMQGDWKEDEIKILPKNVERNKSIQNIENEQSQSLLIAADYYGDDTTVNEVPTGILLQTLYNGCKKFINIFEPYLYQDFFSAACSSFNVNNRGDFCVAVNGCEIFSDDFKNVIFQYYKLPTFNIELKEKVSAVAVTIPKTENLEDSRSASITTAQFKPYTQKNAFDNTTTHNNLSVQIIRNYLPDGNDIRNIPALLHIVKMFDDGKMLENKHRATIAKAIIDECLNYQPERVLKRQDFFTLTRNLVCAFPKEVESTYFIPSQPNFHARGKLWNAYNNKRRMLANSGVLELRHPINVKRKHQSDAESDKTNDKIFVRDYACESNDFSFNSIHEWDTIKEKWSETHTERREELLKEKLLPKHYMQKYSVLKSNRGLELMEIDVNILHPTVVDISNWLSFYHRIVVRGRALLKVETMPQILGNIDNSNDERYRASIALMIIPYIFPYNARRSDIGQEKATKYNIQKRFIKEYATLDDLKSDIECADLQLRFVHTDQQISYAEFKICGHVFKCGDLLEALNTVFHYIMALNVEYPRMCLHIWQFIQLAIFQIEIKHFMQPNVESTFNDLCMS